MSEHKRTKFGHLPGDLSLRGLIRLKERGFYRVVGLGVEFGSEEARMLRRYLKAKGKVIQRRRDSRAIREGMEG